MKRHKALKKHREKRALERMGATLSPGLHRELVEMIQSGKAEPIRRTTHTKSLFRMEIGGKPMIVAYNKKFHEIASMWPDEGGDDDQG